LKYAFPDGRPGEILISLSEQGEQVMLRISDNGVGLPQAASSPSGVGLSWHYRRQANPGGSLCQKSHCRTRPGLTLRHLKRTFSQDPFLSVFHHHFHRLYVTILFSW
jgi:two-component sensor histidine kinase